MAANTQGVELEQKPDQSVPLVYQCQLHVTFERPARNRLSIGKSNNWKCRKRMPKMKQKVKRWETLPTMKDNRHFLPSSSARTRPDVLHLIYVKCLKIMLKSWTFLEFLCESTRMKTNDAQSNLACIERDARPKTEPVAKNGRIETPGSCL